MYSKNWTARFLGALREEDLSSSSSDEEAEEMPRELNKLNNPIIITRADIHRISWCDYKIVTRIEETATSLRK